MNDNTPAAPEAPAAPTLTKSQMKRIARRDAFRANWRVIKTDGKPYNVGNNKKKRDYKFAVKAERDWAKEKLKAEGLYGKVRVTALIAKVRAELKAKDAGSAQ